MQLANSGVVNPVAGLEYRTPSKAAVDEFSRILHDGHLNVVIRYRRGGVQPDPNGAELQPIEAGQIIARISDQVVLAGDVLPQVNSILKKYADQIPPGQLEAARRQLMQRQLSELIETKILYAEFTRTIPAW